MLTASNPSSLVIDDLCDHRTDDTAIAMFYCDFRDRQELTATNIMGAILKQLFRGNVPAHVRSAFRRAERDVGGRGLRLPDMVQMLKQAVSTFPQVFICIDALDECPSKHLPMLLKSIQDVLEESPRTRIFVTGRPHVEAEITKCFATRLMVPISPKAPDIKIYLEKKLEMDPEPEVMTDTLRADILRIIPERFSEMYVQAQSPFHA